MPVDPRIQAILDGPMTTRTDLRFAPMRGHASAPGTGPVGETCGSCRHRHPTDSSYRTWTCDAVSKFSADRGTPISQHEKACGRWQARR